MWREISKEGYPKDIENYLLTDGKDYFVGYWREDAKAWDNFNNGWVRTSVNDDDSYLKATHWMELPALPNYEQIVEKMSNEEAKRIIAEESCSGCKWYVNDDCIEEMGKCFEAKAMSIYALEMAEQLFKLGDNWKSFLERENSVANYVESISKETGVDFYDF